MNTYFVILATLVASSTAFGIQKCGGTAQFNLNDIKITGCGRPRTCTFIKGRDANMTLPFTPNHMVTEVTANVHGIIVIPIPFPLPNSNACHNSGLHCPMEPHQPQTYTASLPVKSSYPSLRVTVQWKLLDQNNRELVCIKFPVQLKS